MTTPVIRAEGLTKLYRIGIRDRRPETLTGHLLQYAKHPVTSFRRLRALSSISENDASSDDVIAALHDVSFTVATGEVLGVVGINGAGKSTLLRLLCGITEPTAGWAEINGRTAGLLEVGTGFHPELTGRENVFLNGAILGMSRADVGRNFDQIIAFAGVEPFIDTPVKRFSSGMKVRLAFAVAAHLEPEVLFIDEVLAVGDAVFQQRCLDRMAELAASGRTILFVSHNLAAVRRLCTSGLLLGGGAVLSRGAMSDVLSDYARITRAIGESQDERGGFGISLPCVRGLQGEMSRARPFEVQWNLSIQREYWHVAAQVGVVTPEGNNVLVASIDSNSHPKLRVPGRLEVRVTFPPLWLAPLSYPLRIKVIAEPQSGPTERYFSPWTVLDVPPDQDLNAPTLTLLAPDAQWSLIPRETGPLTGSAPGPITEHRRSS